MIRFLQSGNRAAKYILGGFLLILAGSMVTYLIPGFMGDAAATGSNVVARVGGQDIKTEDIAKAVAAQQRQQRYPDMLIPYLNQQVVRQMIQQAEIDYEAQRMGLKVSDDELRSELQTGPYKETFFPGGTWMGTDKYKQLLSDNNMTVQDFERDVRRDLMRRKLFMTVAASASVPSAEVEQAYKDKNVKVKFQYAILLTDEVKKGIKPTETELKAYFDANKPKYQNSVPEKRQLKYFVLDDKMAESKVTVDPAELQRYYAGHQDEYRTPDRVRVRHVLVSVPAAQQNDAKLMEQARNKAQDILKQLKSGADFAALAKKDSQDPGSAEKGGEMGWVLKGQTVAEFEKVAFSQSKGQISDPVLSPFGYHIIQTEEKEDAHVKPLSEVKAQIEPILKQQKVQAVVEKMSTDAQAAAKKDGLDKAAGKFGVQVVESNMVTRGDTLPGVGGAQNLMSEIFASDPKAGPQGGRAQEGSVIYQVTKVEPARTPNFEEVKTRVTNEFQSERANDIVRRKAQEMADRAHASHDLAKAAKEAGATMKTSELVTRSSQVPDLGAMAGPASQVFTLKQGEISTPINIGKGEAVLELTERQDPSLSDPQFAKDRDQLREQLAQEKQSETLNLYIGSLSTRLEKEGKVRINKDVMDRLTKSRGGPAS